MSTSNFPACLAFTLREEGGFVDNPDDPGGATNQGITLTTLRHITGKSSLTVADLQGISPSLVSLIYLQDYWMPVRGDELLAGLDLMVFDMGVNAGPRVSITLLQKALGVVQDGDFGPQTLAAAQTSDPVTLAHLYADQFDYYKQLLNFTTFGKGWLARALARYLAAVEMATKPTP